MALWLAGIIAGLIAGIAMAMVAMMLMPMMGRDMWSPVKLMAGTFQGEAALEGGAGTILLGMMIHMGMSAVLGLIFALIVGALGWAGLWALIVAGIVYALIVWAVNQYATLPVVDKVMAERMPPMAFAVTHVFYGAVLGWLVAVFA
jgi:hypothetical protein